METANGMKGYRHWIIGLFIRATNLKSVIRRDRQMPPFFLFHPFETVLIRIYHGRV